MPRALPQRSGIRGYVCESSITSRHRSEHATHYRLWPISERRRGAVRPIISFSAVRFPR